jgi:hypothetical protein
MLDKSFRNIYVEIDVGRLVGFKSGEGVWPTLIDLDHH